MTIVFTRLDASSHTKRLSDGAVAWVTLGSSGDILDQWYTWILVLLTLLSKSGMVCNIVGVHHVICNDNSGILLRIFYVSVEHPVENENMKKWAGLIWKQIQTTFPANTTLKWVPRDNIN